MAKKKTTSEPAAVPNDPVPAAEPEQAVGAYASAPKKRGRKAKQIEPEPTPTDAAPAVEPIAGDEPIAVDGAPASAPKKKGKKARAVAGDATLADVFAGYLRSLEEAGKSEGTIFSYRLELTTAGAKFGIDSKLAELTPERVLLFFTSDRVMKTRSGRPKSPLSIDKTRRVIRQALMWAETAGLVAKAPVPELTATH